MIVCIISDEHLRALFSPHFFADRLYKGKKISDAEQRLPIKHIVFYFSASVIFARSMEVADYNASAIYPIKKRIIIQGIE